MGDSKIEELERRISELEELFEKKRRDDNDILSNLDETNFSDEFLKLIRSGSNG